jgi:DNA-directed RNA polymerase subunit RPC12/RpoP
MLEALKCPNCGAPYAKKVPQWVTSVRCEHCGCQILIGKGSDRSQTVRVIHIAEETPPKNKTFCLTKFAEFMRSKGYALDPVSGLLKLGHATISISEDGVVDGPEPFKARAERWVSEYMKA